MYMFLTEKKKDSVDAKWHIIIGAIILAPIVIVLTIAVLAIAPIMDKKERIDREKEKKAIENHQIRAKKTFDSYHSSLLPSLELEQVGELLKGIKPDEIRFHLDFFLEEESSVGDSILECLNLIKVPDGYKLDIEPLSYEGCGGRSYIIVEDSDGNHHTNIFDFLYVEDSPMGAWQAYLLDRMWHYLPFYWHGYYDQRFYIYSQEKLQKMGFSDARSVDAPAMSLFENREKPNSTSLAQCNVKPVVYQKENKYYVSSCYWSDFAGLVREVVEISMNKNKVSEVFDVYHETLYQYHCGIMY